MRVVLAMLALAATPAAADTLWDMCYSRGNQGPEQCECVTAGLQAELAAPDHALYSAVASRYLKNLADGKAKDQAWEMAVQRESAERMENWAAFSARVARLADAHTEIRLRCAGQ